MKIFHSLFWILIGSILALTACTTQKSIGKLNANPDHGLIQTLKLSGGSSGMEQIDDHSYLAVYDLKRNSANARLGLIRVTPSSLIVSPIKVDSWGDEGIANDLESICAIPERKNEYLLAESGNWQGKFGRIFHVKVDTLTLSATVLGSTKIPMLFRNDMTVVGDQYEAIICLPYDKGHRIVMLGERGGSDNNPHGVVRWGLLNLEDHSFHMGDEGLAGIPVTVPGNWVHTETKRDITDFHLDAKGDIWAAASEDLGDKGPFYSVIYKLGRLDLENKERPFSVFESITTRKAVTGFKIEALSGPCKGISASHAFGTEDEIYGGVWRPIHIE